MASESPESPLVAEHAFPLRVGCAAQGCAVMVLAVIGSLAAATLPAGYVRIVNGDVPLGVILCVVSVIGLPALILAPILMLSGVREMLNPQYLILTSTAIVLPKRLREPPLVDQNNPKPNPPGPQPAIIPFSAIRAIRKGVGRDGRLQIDHELAPSTLILHEFELTITDFEKLEQALTAAVPEVFPAIPPKATNAGG